MKKTFLLFFTLLINCVNAQEPEKLKPFQFSFVTPLGTNGMESPTTANKLSLNLLVGINGGVKGSEISGLIGINNGDVEGIQIAGFGNINQRSTFGLQVGGFMNINRSTTFGSQFAGFLNLSQDSLSGGQFAGFTNLTTRNLKGIQASGFLNLVRGDLTGTQISGFLNIAKNVRGAQIGIINISDSYSIGMPIGLLSIVKNGYKAWEFSYSESFQARASFKTGVNHFYNILSIIGSKEKDDFLWGYGYGIGTKIRFSRYSNTALNFDLIAYQLQKNEDWKLNELNLLAQFHSTLSFQIFRGFSVFGGIIFNAHIREKNNLNEFSAYPNFKPRVWHEYKDSFSQFHFYPEFTVGLRF